MFLLLPTLATLDFLVNGGAIAAEPLALVHSRPVRLFADSLKTSTADYNTEIPDFSFSFQKNYFVVVGDRAIREDARVFSSRVSSVPMKKY